MSLKLIKAISSLLLVAILGTAIAQAAPAQQSDPANVAGYRTYLPLVAAPRPQEWRNPKSYDRLVPVELSDMTCRWVSNRGQWDFCWADFWAGAPNLMALPLKTPPGVDPFDMNGVASVPVGALPAEILALEELPPMSEMREVDPNSPLARPQQSVVEIFWVVLVAGYVVVGFVTLAGTETTYMLVQERDSNPWAELLYSIQPWWELNPTEARQIVPWYATWDENVQDSPWTFDEIEAGAPVQAEADGLRYWANTRPSWWGRAPTGGAVKIPAPAPGIPEPPDHVLDHPRDQIPGFENTSAVKTAAWVNFWNAAREAVTGGPPPDGCFERRDKNGRLLARMAVFLERYVQFVGGTRIKGVAVLVNHQQNGPDTAMADFYRNRQGKIVSSWRDPNGKLQNILGSFTNFPCPPSDQLQSWMLGY